MKSDENPNPATRKGRSDILSNGSKSRKLTAEQVTAIRTTFDPLLDSTVCFGKTYEVHTSTIYKILMNLTYKEVGTSRFNRSVARKFREEILWLKELD